MKHKLISIFLTCFIISLVILAGPAKGINVDLATDKKTYEQGEPIIFTASVDIHDNERLPARELRLILNNDVVCTFDLKGNMISGCSDMLIEVLSSNAEYGYGYNQAAGFGRSNGDLMNATTDFGYGYGYGYDSSNPQELLYKITWDSSNAELQDYEARFAIFASNDKSFEYLTEDTSKFKVVQSEINNIKETVYAENANMVIINSTSNFDKFGKVTFNGDFRHKNLKDSSSAIGGYGTLNIDAYNDDSTHITLQIKFNPKQINAFNSQKTDLVGDAKIDYQKTKRGTRLNGQWVGTEPTVKFSGTISNAKLKIENGMLDFSSDDPLFSFASQQMTITKLDYSEYTYEYYFRNGKLIRKTNINRVRIP